MQIFINYSGTETSLAEAVQKANDVLNSALLHLKLSEKQSFDESNASGKIISDLIKNSQILAKVELYKSPWPWSKANAYTTPLQPDNIYFNSRKLSDYSSNDIACTLIHEFVHLVDFESSSYFFAHGSNYSLNKGNTAPYWIDQLAMEILNKI